MIFKVLFLMALSAQYVKGVEIFLGCYESEYDNKYTKFSANSTEKECLKICADKYFRYALLNQDVVCFCSNHIGSEYSSDRCAIKCVSCPQAASLSDVYETGIKVSGPPQKLHIENVTDKTVSISWSQPQSFSEFQIYEVGMKVLHTFASYIPESPRWTFPHNSLGNEFFVHPGTKYNITIEAVTSSGIHSVPAYTTFESEIGVPDDIPKTPIVQNRHKSTIEVKLSPVTNNNGPITAYRVAVVDTNLKQILLKEDIRSYQDAQQEGVVGYYVTAELVPEEIGSIFIVGNGKTYRGFYNAPLDPAASYDLLLGVVSSYNNVTKIVYSNSSDLRNRNSITHIPYMDSETHENGSMVVIVLAIGIAFLTCVLIFGIVSFYILTQRVSNRRRRLTDNQELTLHGPMIEVENEGYIPEQEIVGVNHYDNLKKQIVDISQASIKIDPTNIVGTGKYGRVNAGTVCLEDKIIQAAIFTIFDRKLEEEKKRSMLKDLDLLIRSNKHINIFSLIGTCETPDTLFVVFDYVPMNLKDLLLGNRDALPGRFSSMQESQAFEIAIGIASGMEHLENVRIVHKQLCARNIMVTDNFVPKIGGYGLAQYYNPNMVPDYTRWMASEVFQLKGAVSKSDVWSFACVLWEICTLGGTPYGNVPNNEIPDRVIRGLRLIQLCYMSDMLYQLLLECWQLDLDERPNFSNIIESLTTLRNDMLSAHLSFNLYPGFQYEQFYPDMELAARAAL